MFFVFFNLGPGLYFIVRGTWISDEQTIKNIKYKIREKIEAHVLNIRNGWSRLSQNLSSIMKITKEILTLILGFRKWSVRRTQILYQKYREYGK